jgi:hypothetical protein
MVSVSAAPERAKRIPVLAPERLRTWNPWSARWRAVAAPI